ncbi:preprotein translocase subunit SecE [Nakamurella leprariae]|uniref:Protein translocase subunit SecE n=1 Tax=Nakamurella leprariae TaxID=2803911 RepID=A0A939C0N4_9ACTN|nr:preprotein translocase subunit SecE [Nakamurella leprariae]MBM9466224.1 preprotein translocase subunit SecE [Nakamurella leprariae]
MSKESEHDDDATSSGAGSADSGEVVGATAGSARAAARRSAGGATPAGAESAPARRAESGRSRAASAGERPNVFARLGRYLREVVAELRKVIWPNRNQMVTYTIVVIVFVVFMVALVYGLDVLFAQGALAVFG